jgi:hypothetical protein
MSDAEIYSPAFMRPLAEAGDDEDQRKLLALAKVLWRRPRAMSL